MKTLTEAQIKFHAALVVAYSDLFKTDPDYSYSASKCTPHELADKMTAAAITGGANFNGKGFSRAAKACGIKSTAKSIKAYLDPLRNAEPLPAACQV